MTAIISLLLAVYYSKISTAKQSQPCAAVTNQWTVPLEWNGGIEYWNDL